MLTGNNILIIESGREYNQKLQQALSETGAQTSVAESIMEAKGLLKARDFDVVICSYFLKDGSIHNVIDWSKGNLENLPVFITIGSELTGDLNSMQRTLISKAYKKNEIGAMIKDIRKLLFNFESFLKGLVEAVEQRGISLEVIVDGEKYSALPVEIDGEGMLIEVQGEVNANTFGYLRIVMYEGYKG